MLTKQGETSNLFRIDISAHKDDRGTHVPNAKILL